MKSDGALKHFILAFVLALGCYALFYSSIEHRRIRKGPWEVTFTNNASGTPIVIVNQHKLAITNYLIAFPGESPPSTNALGKLLFSRWQDMVSLYQEKARLDSSASLCPPGSITHCQALQFVARP